MSVLWLITTSGFFYVLRHLDDIINAFLVFFYESLTNCKDV